VALDPNWFYSSLAQCGAAVVGLLGGVLVTRLQRQIAETQEPRRAFDQWRTDLAATLRQHVPRAEEFRQEIEALLDKAAGPVELKGTPPTTFGVRQQFPAPSNSAIVNNYAVTAELLQQQRERLSVVTEATRLLRALQGAKTPEEACAVSAQLQMLDSKAGSDAGPIAADYVARTGAIMTYATRLRDIASTKAATVVLGVLATLCAAGIIAPLAYLTALEGASKVVLLSIFAMTLGALLIYIRYQITELTQLGSTRLDGPAA
jgi:hypothetical protein